jgi:hypothetical protein
MKYLHYILTLTLIAGLIGILSSFLSSSNPKPDPDALTINSHIISAAELETRQQKYTYAFTEHSGDQDFIEDLITKELLIQEAQKQKIDREDAFQSAISSYYEQSLVKTLIDRQYESLSSGVDEQTLAAYISAHSGLYELEIMTYPDLQSAARNEPTAQENLRDDYFNLTEDVRDIIADLAMGEMSAPLAVDSHFERIRLTGISPSIMTEDIKSSKVVIALYEEDYLRQEMKKWLQSLRSAADIDFPSEYNQAENQK